MTRKRITGRAVGSRPGRPGRLDPSARPVRVVVATRALADELGLDLPAADDADGLGTAGDPGDGASGDAHAGLDPGAARSWRLERGADGLALVRPDGVRLRADLAGGRARARAGEAALAGQPLARALGIAKLAARLGRPPRLVDATAGLGVDGWQAAALGARVTMLEREPVVHALLADALARARAADDPRVRAIADRVALELADAVARLTALGTGVADARPELVYLDPMYPSARRRGRSRKGIEFLHELVGPPETGGAGDDSDGGSDGGPGGDPTLLDAALGAATHRVVVKRPSGAPPLPSSRGARPEPIEAPNTRWDRYAPWRESTAWTVALARRASLPNDPRPDRRHRPSDTAMNAASRTLERHRFDVNEYRRMGETGVLGPDARVELIDGEIIDMPPIGPSHNAAVNRLNRTLTIAVGERAIVQVQGSFELSNRSEPEPDLALFAPRDDFYEHALPRPADVLLVIEVADATLVRDRDVKLPLYARRGVIEAWLVDLEGRRLTVHTDPTPDGYASVSVPPELGAVSPSRLRSVAIDLSWLG